MKDAAAALYNVTGDVTTHGKWGEIRVNVCMYVVCIYVCVCSM